MPISENQAQRLNKSMPVAKDTSLGTIIKGLEEKVAQIPKKVDKQPDSTATDVAGVVKDLNALIAKLKAAGIMMP
ncbi:head fiber protein [Bacillus thuringiensis]|uniref:head fiber protein n=1 Tax=Bacillus thuringiensis TaxID=1428 RepID=UPI0021D68E91|nr:head fiber protein [Bacillus thuringiensis]MCU7663753.1 head fiber protein [Bacillus thuringiensis]